jgi:hypothetical protein
MFQQEGLANTVRLHVGRAERDAAVTLILERRYTSCYGAGH